MLGWLLPVPMSGFGAGAGFAAAAVEPAGAWALHCQFSRPGSGLGDMLHAAYQYFLRLSSLFCIYPNIVSAIAYFLSSCILLRSPQTAYFLSNCLFFKQLPIF